jgi:oxaloacetate decarboxylase alpha subunit
MTTRKFKIRIDGKVFEAEVEELGEKKAVQATPPTAKTIQAPLPQAGSGNSVVAPMPGKVLAIKVSKGQQVTAGDTVLILEAMKMEQEIKSSISGTVSEIPVSENDTVKKDQPLVLLG